MMPTKQQTYDVILIGTGVAGLSNAIYLAEQCIKDTKNLSILVLSKASLSQTNTSWAQGGIAAVAFEEDSFKAHINDTLDAGAFANDPYIVKKVVMAAPEAMHDLIRWEIQLDKKQDGKYDLVKEGGHQHARIWHKADYTGLALQEALQNRISQLPMIELAQNIGVVSVTKTEQGQFSMTVVDLRDQKINQPNQDDFLFNSSDLHQLNCQYVVIASGGLGMVYAQSTNQNIATGDGYLFAHQLGATIKDLSYIQFHPTGLYESSTSTTFLISEALRGAGAILRNEQGLDFMPQYDSRGSLAPRDIVSRSIFMEMRQSSIPHVFLDATMLSDEDIALHFPNIASACATKLGINIKKEWIPVVPVQHYACGGVAVDEYGEVLGVKALYAVGEVASTGLHGANRLASNSLLEGLVFAKCCAASICQSFQTKVINQPVQERTAQLVVKKLDRKLIQQCLTNYAGIVKTTDNLQQGLVTLLHMLDESEVLSMYSMHDWENNTLCQIGILIFKDALAQAHNKGVFFNQDFV